MSKILLTAGWDVAPELDDLIIWKGAEKINTAELYNLVAQHRPAAIVCGDEIYNELVLDYIFSRGVRILSRAGNGWDNIDRKYAKKLGITVLRQKAAYSESVADSTMAFILAFARRLVSLNKSMHAGKWERERFPGIALNEATIGIIGFGNIGKQVYWRAEAFGGTVLIHSPLNNGVDSIPLDELLERSDFVTLHLKYCEDTHHFIGKDELALMKPTAYLINTSRGGLVDTDALYSAVFRNKIAGAALDVFEEEPLPKAHMLRGLDNVILSPHNSYWSPAERERVVLNAIKDARKIL